MNRGVALVTGIGLGVGLMYILDPAGGRRRRALARDKMSSWWRTGTSTLEKTSRDIGNRTRGVMAEMGRKSEAEEVNDSRLEGRVRSRIGRAVSYPSAVTVNAQSGRVVLTGDVLESELSNLLTAVANVTGVVTTENNLNVHETADNVMALQGPGRSPRLGYLRPRSWTPATWAVIGATGGGVAAYYAIRQAVRPPAPWWRRALSAADLRRLDWRKALDAVDWRGAIDRIEMPSYDYTRLARWSPETRVLAGAAGGTMAYYLTRAIWNRRTPRSRWQRVMSAMPRMSTVADRLQLQSWPKVPRAVANQVNRWVQ